MAILPLLELKFQGGQPLRPGWAVCSGHHQAMGASPATPHERKEERVSAPGEQDGWRLGAQNLRPEEDEPTLGIFEPTRIHDLPRCDKIGVARFYPPLPI